jgi:hypothetical protein
MIKARPRMWVSSIEEKKRQKGKTLEEQHKTRFKWAKTKRGMMNRSP